MPWQVLLVREYKIAIQFDTGTQRSKERIDTRQRVLVLVVGDDIHEYATRQRHVYVSTNWFILPLQEVVVVCL